MIRAARIAVLAVVMAAAWPRASRAEELLAIPFVGGTFHGQTTLPVFGDLPSNGTAIPIDLSKSLVIGGAGMWLTSGIIGAEAELAHSRRFFERVGTLVIPASVTSSSITTFTGSVVIAVPLSVTRDSLRPYVVGGLGLLHVGVTDAIRINELDRNLLGLTLGGGAIGKLSDHTGVRFDLRKTRSLRDDRNPGDRLSFWRATVGVTLRY